MYIKVESLQKESLIEREREIRRKEIQNLKGEIEKERESKRCRLRRSQGSS